MANSDTIDSKGVPKVSKEKLEGPFKPSGEEFISWERIPKKGQIVFDDNDRMELDEAWEALRPRTKKFSDFAREMIFLGIDFAIEMSNRMGKDAPPSDKILATKVANILRERGEVVGTGRQPGALSKESGVESKSG